MIRAALASLAACLLLCPRWAAADGEYVVILEFEGQRASSARGAVVGALQGQVELVPLEEFEAAASEEGVRRLEGRGLSRACAPVHAKAAIAGQVVSENGTSLQLTLLDCADGSVLDQYTVPYRGRRLNTDALRGQLAQLVSRISEAHGAGDEEDRPRPTRTSRTAVRGAVEDESSEAEPEEESDEEEDEAEEEADEEAEAEEEEADEPAGGPIQRDMFSLGASVEFAGRAFLYTDPITNNLRPYHVFGVPLIAAGAEVYPMARSHSPILGDLGIVASYSRAMGLSSELSGGQEVDTTWDRLGLGARARIRTGRGGPVFGVSATYGFLHFQFSGVDEVLSEELPDVSYNYLRGGIDARVPYGRFSLLVGAGFLGVLSAGAVADRFPRSSANGADAYAGATLQIVSALEARVTAQYTRFFYTMSPEVGDSYVAGGALDEFLGLQIGVAYVN